MLSGVVDYFHPIRREDLMLAEVEYHHREAARP
jgi:hypothetical protein